MRLLTLILILTVLVGMEVASGQSAERKARKERLRIEKEKEIAALVDSFDFLFKADRSLTAGYGSVDLTTNPNYLKVSHERIVSQLPFFGRAYTMTYGGEGGLKFEGKPGTPVISRKKHVTEIEIRVKGVNDSYQLSLSVGPDGGSTLTVFSNNLESVTYHGRICAPEPVNATPY